MDSDKVKDPGCSANSSSPSDSPVKDKLFDPSIDMLINDFDDEGTLEEEEALAAAEVTDTAEELSSLEKESHMPLEQLLAMYGYKNTSPNIVLETIEILSSSEEEEIARARAGAGKAQPVVERRRNPPRKSKLALLYEPLGDDNFPQYLPGVARILSDDDNDYSDIEQFRVRKGNHTIMVGSDYQAKVPLGSSPYSRLQPANDAEDVPLFNPYRLDPSEVEEYLKKVYETVNYDNPNVDLIRDDEEALHTLHKFDYKVDDALEDLRARKPEIPKTDNPKNDVRWLEEKPVNGTKPNKADKHFLKLGQK